MYDQQCPSLGGVDAFWNGGNIFDKIINRTPSCLNNNIYYWFLFNLKKKKITCKCYTEFYWDISISCLTAQVTIRHTRMQTSFSSLANRGEKKGERERERPRESEGGRCHLSSGAVRRKRIHQKVAMTSVIPVQGTATIDCWNPCVVYDIKKKNKIQKHHTNQGTLDCETCLDQLWLCSSLTFTAQTCGWLRNHLYKTH